MMTGNLLMITTIFYYVSLLQSLLQAYVSLLQAYNAHVQVLPVCAKRNIGMSTLGNII